MPDFGHASSLLYTLEHGHRSRIREVHRDRLMHADGSLTDAGEKLARSERERLRNTVWRCRKCHATASWPEDENRPVASCGHSFSWDYTSDPIGG